LHIGGGSAPDRRGRRAGMWQSLGLSAAASIQS
jgi:hypothetical protein